MGPSYIRAALAASAIACMLALAAPAAAQYVNVNDDITDMARRALSQDALQSHGAGANGNTPEVDLRLAFPSAQTGLDNIMTVLLEPLDGGAHQCESIAVKNGTEVISATFIPKKDVRPGHVYDVVVSDSMGDKYAVGRIRVGAGSPQAYTINAPLLTPSSPRYTGPSTTSADSAAAPAARTNDMASFGQAIQSQAVQAPMLGLSGATVTPRLLALAGAKTRSFHGVIVAEVEKGGIAGGSGIRAGDVIFGVDGHPCASIQQLVSVTQDQQAPAKAIDIAFLRSEANGPAVHHVKVPSARLLALVGAMQSQAVAVPALGLRGVTITPALLALGGAPAKSFKGVGVFDVQDGSLAQRSGLSEGDIIVDVDGQPCATVQQLISWTRRVAGQGQPLDLTVARHDAAGELHTRHVSIALDGGS
ncbi:MAG TPA: PDZ domain-containing protein [Candidatus Dormibacteraeota bacterium]|nr:PDZ domain-containing protein [Candidatus Dormibacteraeota bacterium]